MAGWLTLHWIQGMSELLMRLTEQLQRNVLTYTTTHREQLKTQALSTHSLHLVSEERRKIIKEEGSKEE